MWVYEAGVFDALEKFAAFTPGFIRTIARDGDVEVDHPAFKETCRGLTGEAHLDKMSPGQLGQVAKMLWSKEAEARAKHKPKAHKAHKVPKAKTPKAKAPPTPSEEPASAVSVPEGLKAVGRMGAGAVGSSLFGGASMAAALVPHDGSDFSKTKNFKELTRAMDAPPTPLKKGVSPGDAYMQHPGHDKGDYSIGLGHDSSEATAAHELGHRKNYAFLDRLFNGNKHTPQGRMNRMKGLLIPGLSRTLATNPLMAHGAALGASLGEEPSWKPGLAYTAVATPMLLDEAAASLHAVKHLVGRYGAGTGLRKAAPLAGAFGTYASLPMYPLGITAARKAWRRYHATPDEAPVE